MAAIMQLLATAPSALPSEASALDASISALRSSIAALDSCIKALEGSSSFWEHLAIVSSFAVFFGIVGEVIVIVSEYLDDVHDWSIGERLWVWKVVSPPGRPPRWRFWFDIIATVVVLLGVLGEAWGSKELASINSQLRSKTSELRADSDQLLALITQEAGSAAQSAREARMDADAAKADLFELRKETGARRLTEKQKRELGDALSAMPTPIAVCRNPLDSEAGDFASDLADALGRGRWPKVYMNWLPNGKHGLYIGFTDSTARNIPQVKLLRKALGDVGFPPQLLQLTVGDKSLSTTAEPHVLYLLIADHPPVATSAKTAPKTTQ